MNREILFKGFHPCENGKDKVFINGEWIKDEWIEGYYVCVGGKHHYILTGKLDITKGHLQYVHYLVIPETVGQYTGLTDKNRKKIFERDIIAYKEKIYIMPFVPVHRVDVIFKRNLPVNNAEVAQMIRDLDGMVTQETLLAQLDFIGDPKEEAELARKEQNEQFKERAVMKIREVQEMSEGGGY